MDDLGRGDMLQRRGTSVFAETASVSKQLGFTGGEWKAKRPQRLVTIMKEV